MFLFQYCSLFKKTRPSNTFENNEFRGWKASLKHHFDYSPQKEAYKIKRDKIYRTIYENHYKAAMQCLKLFISSCNEC